MPIQKFILPEQSEEAAAALAAAFAKAGMPQAATEEVTCVGYIPGEPETPLGQHTVWVDSEGRASLLSNGGFVAQFRTSCRDDAVRAAMCLNTHDALYDALTAARTLLNRILNIDYTGDDEIDAVIDQSDAAFRQVREQRGTP